MARRLWPALAATALLAFGPADGERFRVGSAQAQLGPRADRRAKGQTSCEREVVAKKPKKAGRRDGPKLTPQEERLEAKAKAKAEKLAKEREEQLAEELAQQRAELISRGIRLTISSVALLAAGMRATNVNVRSGMGVDVPASLWSLDTNNDGFVDRGEFLDALDHTAANRTWLMSMFTRVDSNADSKLDGQELRTLAYDDEAIVHLRAKLKTAKEPPKVVESSSGFVSAAPLVGAYQVARILDDLLDDFERTGDRERIRPIVNDLIAENLDKPDVIRELLERTADLFADPEPKTEDWKPGLSQEWRTFLAGPVVKNTPHGDVRLQRRSGKWEEIEHVKAAGPDEAGEDEGDSSEEDEEFHKHRDEEDVERMETEEEEEAASSVVESASHAEVDESRSRAERDESEREDHFDPDEDGAETQRRLRSRGDEREVQADERPQEKQRKSSSGEAEMKEEAVKRSKQDHMEEGSEDETRGEEEAAKEEEEEVRERERDPGVEEGQQANKRGRRSLARRNGAKEEKHGGEEVASGRESLHEDGELDVEEGAVAEGMKEASANGRVNADGKGGEAPPAPPGGAASGKVQRPAGKAPRPTGDPPPRRRARQRPWAA